MEYKDLNYFLSIYSNKELFKDFSKKLIDFEIHKIVGILK